ncbi:type I-F CRISPR-associated protein Csy3 [Erwinia psidii]|uniref:Type I-F CRISPR-associated protein Csy3 n=1 Tax=Erwinia psidii TaxID=69224 RepID=A0A3N6RZ21_9GAMM|nr:type I-F CRISPR-associated protein Csy3 [Erwinia psidii]MCX8957822.1 type I-F CRISPR-associated protein Csy3 [Erwinia psidii]MCX8960872.1 type I-F CRISPR-associated protein Csy3 [Erwinia psidii]MCX8964888.1 type I-F CRISPR-associated protein Csy3 [Erwinia psidii]RQM38438.1 type I-F CRISPR-associated protein Csy3 [Erwinia psidii]
MAKSTIKTASVLAFERKLSNSDAMMYACNWQQPEQRQAIEIKEKAVRGTISNRLKNALVSDPAKLDAEIQKANLQRVDIAALPFDADTLNVSFTLRVLGNLAVPSVCNDQEYQAALSEVINRYIAEQGMGVLAARYAENLANARFLWRNRVGADEIRVCVTGKSQPFEFDSTRLSLREFSQPAGDLAQLAREIEQGLTGDSFAFFSIDAFVRLGKGQEIFPSQELVLDSNSKKSKVLYQVDGCAALHSQKVGNALRTIDSWYPSAATLELGPIAVEPYGSVTSRGKAYRQPKDKMDFYTLLDNWVTKGIKPETEQQHYVMAVLIRGGVFGEKGE